ncbi:MAG: 6-bladed beta-propeller [Balneola sp.]|jgi:hypothetical protein
MNNMYVLVLLSLFICNNCTDDIALKQVEKEIVGQIKITEHISFIDEIPKHIEKVENLTIFKEDFEPTHTLKLIPLQEFGKDKISNFASIFKSFEDKKGNLIIWGWDLNQKSSVYVYNNDGSYKTQLGRQGKGPGEYGIILNLDVKAGKVYISDFTSLRLNEYSTDNYFVDRSINLEVWNDIDDLKFKNQVIPRNDGNYLAAYTERVLQNGQIELMYILMDSIGVRQKFNMLTIPAGFTIDIRQRSSIPKPTLPLWFMGNTAIALTNEDALYTVSTREFLVKKYNAFGQYQSAFYYPIEGPSFVLDDYLKTAGSLAPKAKQIKKAFDQMDEELPQTSPFIEHMIVDDENRIWIAVTAGENYEWWILKESGELLAKLMLPKKKPIFDIKKGFLYSKELNEEGFEYVLKYRIEISEK